MSLLRKTALSVLRLTALSVLAFSLMACGSNPSAPSKPRGLQDAAPRTNQALIAKLAALPDPKVVAVTPTKRGNGPVYTVFGKSYRVMSSALGFVQEGPASWYGTKFHGRQTSSGEPFDIYKLTAAHKHLPIPCYVRVTNLENGRQTVVRVNDRGPFHGDRIIDLSYAAAVKLDFHNQGTARVRIEVLQPERKLNRFIVQAGSFATFAGASRAQQQVESLIDMKTFVVKTADGFYRVQLGPIQEGAILERVKAFLVASDFGKPILQPVP